MLDEPTGELRTATVPRKGAGGGLMARLAGLFRPPRKPLHDNHQFTSALVSLAAKMAAADGVAVKVELDAFERFLEIGPADRARVESLYRQAAEHTAGYEAYADRIGAILADDPAMRLNVLECLLLIACADGVLHPAEDQFLHRVAARFHISDADFRCLKGRFVDDPECPYLVLGLAPQAADAEVKRAYRRLAAEAHPDRHMARGAPPAVIKAQTAKLTHINAAYEAIRKARAAGGSA